MACNENVIKNMATEITRNCQAQNVNIEVEFVVYLIGYLLNNPKYGKLFTKTLNRNNLEYFVNECVAMLTRGETSMNTLKMQFIIQVNYDKMQRLVDKHLDSIDRCLRPLVNEILDADPGSEDEAEIAKLYRKIAIYIVLASGLGNPSYIMTLKEGMAALESVLTLKELEEFLTYPRPDKLAKLKELLAVTSGVRLFNRDCKKAGEGIPDLPYNLVDAGKACIFTLSHSLIGVMQRVNSLTTAAADCVSVEEETGNVYIKVPPGSDLTVEHYKQIIDLLSFNRQYEIYIRRLLADIESTVQSGAQLVDSFQEVLDEIHDAVKYKEAVPVVTVFPLFTKLWQVWRSMQTTMFLISTVNRLMTILSGIQERTKIPVATLEKMLKGKAVVTDQERMTGKVSLDDRLSLAGLSNYVAFSESFAHANAKERHVQFLGFCALCLNVGALVPSNMKIGIMKHAGRRYGFCNFKMASRFSKEPERYVNEVLDYARNNPHIVSLLNIQDDVARVKDIDCLVVRYEPKIHVLDKDVQTDTHPIEKYIEKNYTSNLWEWKQRACQWASIANCQTHSTQTNYSHLRSEIHCQTVDHRNKCFQTKKDTGMNTNVCSFFLWGLRGQLGDHQHSMDLVLPHSPKKQQAEHLYRCKWPCIDREMQIGSPCSLEMESSSEDEIAAAAPTADDGNDFYVPDGLKKPSLFRNDSRMVKKKEDL